MEPEETLTPLVRRRFLRAAFGAVGLSALATGLPRSVLQNPLSSRALAQASAPKRMLILFTSGAGDPINCNVPGTYEDPSLVHSSAPSMAPVDFPLGTARVRAARPWAELPPSVHERMCFFHHATYANTHPSQPKVMKLTGLMSEDEMYVSMLAKHIAPALGTTQTEPISLGASTGTELLSFEGRTLSAVKPVALRQILSVPGGPLADLQGLRDRRIDALYALFKEHGTENHRRMLDRFAQSREEARTISLDLLDRLEGVRSNDAASQVSAAPVLAAMNVSPVLVLRIPFGGDNHADPGLGREAAQTVSGVRHLGQLVANLDGLRDEGILNTDVVVANLSVFGRTLARQGQGGRDHNGNHHVSVMIGRSIAPSVIGGVVPIGDDYGASAFDRATGSASEGGDVSFDDSFGAMAKTLGSALGIDDDTLDEAIDSGTSVPAALRAE